MTTTTRHSYKLSIKRATRIRRRRHPPQHRKIASSIATFKVPMQKCNNHHHGLSQKLEALKNLIPTHTADTVKPDQLFKETADYIVLLRTRVALLQNLIDFYANHAHNHNIWVGTLVEEKFEWGYGEGKGWGFRNL
ncbi:hypothetical protein Fmac_016664 [Flemingia macrophylla]|uniref:Uncharacterized protein n=1 Tax=Flemingia macrophylla TaxID=520843 RepID=A0ABD1MI33_9FABA